MNDYLMRSLMFVPAHNDKLMRSAAKVKADVLLLDIEDSVQPVENKQVARDKILEYLKNDIFKGRKVFPRINDRESGQLLKDIMQLTVPDVEGFMYPKAKKGEDIYFFDKLLETIEYEKNLKIGTYKIIPLIETAAAVLNVQEICGASSRVVAIAYGSEDFIADLEGIHDMEHLSLFNPRALIAMGARANNVVPIDTVHVRVKDFADLEQNLKLSVKLGFEGMLVLNPMELDLIHKYYSPSQEEVSDSKEMLRLDKIAKSEGKGVAIMNGKFADLTIFSFHPVKHIASGEGGMITTNDKALYERLLSLRTHGIIKDADKYTNKLEFANGERSDTYPGWYMEMQHLGFNYRITDFQAALGNSQLKRAENGIQKRRQIANTYYNEFKSNPNILNQSGIVEGHAYHLYVIEVKDRLGLYNHLRKNNIYAQIHYIPCHLMPYYRSFGWKEGDMPNAEDYYKQCISLPMFPTLTDEEQLFIVHSVIEFIGS